MSYFEGEMIVSLRAPVVWSEGGADFRRDGITGHPVKHVPFRRAVFGFGDFCASLVRLSHGICGQGWRGSRAGYGRR